MKTINNTPEDLLIWTIKTVGIIALIVSTVLTADYYFRHHQKVLENRQLDEMLEYHSSPDCLTLEHDGYINKVTQ